MTLYEPALGTPVSQMGLWERSDPPVRRPTLAGCGGRVESRRRGAAAADQCPPFEQGPSARPPTIGMSGLVGGGMLPDLAMIFWSNLTMI